MEPPAMMFLFAPLSSKTASASTAD
jgi:hypothetical protein